MLIDFSHHYSFIKVSGQDAKKLLQGQLTCDIEKITSETNQLAAHCNPQGRIISLFRLFYLNDVFYLWMPRDMVSLSIAALKKYAVFYKTEIRLDDEMFSFGMIDEQPALSSMLEPVSIFKMEQPSIPHQANAFIIVGEKKALEKTLASFSHQQVSGNINIWKAFHFKTGIPQIYAQSSGKFLPHEINLHHLNAIDFEKGCYTGQEIIARMHYRGKLKKHMCCMYLNFETPPTPGLELVYKKDDTNIVRGMLVDSFHESNDQYQVLIVTEKKQ